MSKRGGGGGVFLINLESATISHVPLPQKHVEQASAADISEMKNQQNDQLYPKAPASAAAASEDKRWTEISFC
jgi:hypothetical protein